MESIALAANAMHAEPFGWLAVIEYDFDVECVRPVGGIGHAGDAASIADSIKGGAVAVGFAQFEDVGFGFARARIERIVEVAKTQEDAVISDVDVRDFHEATDAIATDAAEGARHALAAREHPVFFVERRVGLVGCVDPCTCDESERRELRISGGEVRGLRVCTRC